MKFGEYLASQRQPGWEEYAQTSASFGAGGAESLSSEKVRHATEIFFIALKGLADEFLNLEKFVNINFTGFHKIFNMINIYLIHVNHFIHNVYKINHGCVVIIQMSLYK